MAEVTKKTLRLQLSLIVAGMALLFGTMYLETKYAIAVFAIGWLILVGVVVAYRYRPREIK